MAMPEAWQRDFRNRASNVRTTITENPPRALGLPLLARYLYFSSRLPQLRAERDLFAKFLPFLPKGGDSGSPSGRLVFGVLNGRCK